MNLMLTLVLLLTSAEYGIVWSRQRLRNSQICDALCNPDSCHCHVSKLHPHVNILEIAGWSKHLRSL